MDNLENRDCCGDMNCKYRSECPAAVGIHYNVWGEGVGCKQGEDNYQAFLRGEDVLPW